METKDCIMQQEDSRKKNIYGQVILTGTDLCELLLQGKRIDRTTVEKDEDIDLFEKYKDQFKQTAELLSPSPESISFDQFHLEHSNKWIFPNEYQNLDLKTWLINKCQTEEEIRRVNLEYELYEQRNLVILLKLFVYLVDYMRKNKFVWGVGRGSSVSSYILYLIGIHRVDSLKYNLDIKEYLK